MPMPISSIFRNTINCVGLNCKIDFTFENLVATFIKLLAIIRRTIKIFAGILILENIFTLFVKSAFRPAIGLKNKKCYNDT